MARILFINSVCTGSTGKICRDLYNIAIEDGHECCIAYGRGKSPKNYNSIKIGSRLGVYSHVLKTRLFDQHGFGSKVDTKKFLKQVDLYEPDIIHIHNIHGYYINIYLLFDYLKKHSKIKIIWTLHDCWAFTGHCAYYTYAKCDKWKKGCSKCSEIMSYPKCFLPSRINKNYKLKKQIFSNVPNLTIVTPSLWLKKEVENSFLNEYKCKVINNGVDLTVFKKTNLDEQINKIVILGIANIWDRRKGLDSFLELSKLINNNYEIIMVGLSKKQIAALPSNIKGLEKTNSVDELVVLYNQASILFNPTLEDNYPTVNLEAQACGLPVVAFNNGGTIETLKSNKSFCVNSVDEFIHCISNMDIKSLKKTFEIDYKTLDKNYVMKKYLELYEGKV